MITEFGIFFTASFFEILGCYSFWMVYKMDKPFYWIFIGVVSLVLFAYLLTKVNLEFAGRAYAIYGGIHIISSLTWLFAVEKQAFTKWDTIGAIIIFIGISIILFSNTKVFK